MHLNRYFFITFTCDITNYLKEQEPWIVRNLFM